MGKENTERKGCGYLLTQLLQKLNLGTPSSDESYDEDSEAAYLLAEYIKKHTSPEDTKQV